MQRREFLLACTAVAISPVPAPAMIEPRISAYVFRYRFTRLEGDSLIYETPWNHMRFETGLVTITNNMYPDDPAWTRLTFAADRWTSITHEGRSQYPGTLVYEGSALLLPPEHYLRPELGDNLSAMTAALYSAKCEQPAWWAKNTFLRQTLEVAQRKIYHGRFPVPDFAF